MSDFSKSCSKKYLNNINANKNTEMILWAEFEYNI